SRWEHGRSTPFARYVPRLLDLVEEQRVPYHAPLGDRIQAYRRRHGLTQQDLADRLGIHQGTLSDWELGLHPPCKRLLLIVEELFKTG
ncbi:MAG: helix-turn-helix transcriptional regulator, partial [Nitrospiraceae bacterium]